MVVYVFKDTFSVKNIEAVCVSQNVPHGLEINTVSGGTYEYSFNDDASRDDALMRLRSALAAVNDCKYMEITPDKQSSIDNALAPKSIDELLNR